MNKFNKVYDMIMEEIKINMPDVRDMTKNALNKVDDKINSLTKKKEKNKFNCPNTVLETVQKELFKLLMIKSNTR